MDQHLVAIAQAHGAHACHATPRRGEEFPLSTLCFTYKGEPFTPPPTATSWRVRRLREGQRGQLDVMRDSAGQPLVLPIAATYEQLREAVGQVAGRYRLDMLDDQSQAIDGEAAYVTVAAPAPAGARNAAPPWEQGGTDDNDVPGPVAAHAVRLTPVMVTAPYGTWPALPQPSAMTSTEYLLSESIRGQTMTIHMLTTALSERSAGTSSGAAHMIGAAVELVRAADGAAMPSRRPPPTPPPPPAPPVPPAPPAAPVIYAMPRNGLHDFDDEDMELDDDEPAADAPSDADMFAKVLAIADKVQGVIAPVADVARMVMGGFGNPAALRNAGDADEPAPAPAPTAPVEASIPSHLYTSHLMLIAHELGADGSRFRRLVMHMEPDARKALTARLCALPFDEAVDEAAALLERLDARRRARAGAAAGEAADASPCANGDAEQDQDQDNDDPGQGDDDEATPPPAQRVSVPEAKPPESPIVSAALAQGGQLVMVPTASLDPLPLPPDQRKVTPPAGVPDVAVRMREIASHLSAFELLKVQTLIGATPQAERDQWFAKLIALPPTEAAALVRAELKRRAG